MPSRMSFRSDCLEEAFATSSNRNPAEITVIFLLGKQAQERKRNNRSKTIRTPWEKELMVYASDLREVLYP